MFRNLMLVATEKYKRQFIVLCKQFKQASQSYFLEKFHNQTILPFITKLNYQVLLFCKQRTVKELSQIILDLFRLLHNLVCKQSLLQ